MSDEQTIAHLEHMVRRGVSIADKGGHDVAPGIAAISKGLGLIYRLRADLARVTAERDEARAIVHMLPDDVLTKARRLVEAAGAEREVADE